MEICLLSDSHRRIIGLVLLVVWPGQSSVSASGYSFRFRLRGDLHVMQACPAAVRFFGLRGCMAAFGACSAAKSSCRGDCFAARRRNLACASIVGESGGAFS